MSTKKLLELVKERGLRIELRDGRPVLIKPPDNDKVTDKLLAVLKFHKDRIIELLK